MEADVNAFILLKSLDYISDFVGGINEFEFANHEPVDLDTFLFI